jgi:hypothetical protein
MSVPPLMSYWSAVSTPLCWYRVSLSLSLLPLLYRSLSLHLLMLFIVLVHPSSCAKRRHNLSYFIRTLCGILHIHNSFFFSLSLLLLALLSLFFFPLLPCRFFLLSPFFLPCMFPFFSVSHDIIKKKYAPQLQASTLPLQRPKKMGGGVKSVSFFFPISNGGCFLARIYTRDSVPLPVLSVLVP